MTDIALAVAEARTQTVLMMILVTRQALFGFNREIIDHIGLRTFDMALLTFMLGMSAEQSIARFLAMIEGLRRLPFLRGVAEAAFVLLEFAFKVVHVVLHVTLVAGVHKAHVTDIVLTSGFVGALGRVTLLAIDLGVTSVQFKAGFTMIEGLRIDIHGIEVTTFVILMAIDTGFVIHQAMEMHLRFHVLANFLVALQTVLVGNTTCGLMAFQAIIVRMFQLIVTDNQRTRGQELVEETFKFHLGRILRQGR